MDEQRTTDGVVGALVRMRPVGRARRRRRRLRVAAVVAIAAFVVGACSTAEPQLDDAEPLGLVRPTDPPAGEVPTTMPTEPVGFDDGLHRVVIVTESNPGLDDVVASDEVVEPAPPSPLGPLSWAVLTDDGRRSLGEPSKSLVPVHPADDVERAIRDAAPAGSMIAVDERGVVGAAGLRYLRTLTELYLLDDLRGALAAAGESASNVSGDGDGAADAAVADEAIAAAIGALDGVVDVTRSADGVISVVLSDPGAADQLAAIDGVVSVAPDGLLSFGADPRQGEQWMIANTGSGAQAGGWPGVEDADTNVDAAWDVTTGAGVVVAVVDSGVDSRHPDLAANIWTNPDETCGNGTDDDGNGLVDDCHGWDYGMSDASADPDPSDGNGFHGTHVAGLVAAARNGVGVVGMAPDATIMPLKVSNSSGGISTSWVAAAIQYAVDEGADIVNLSLGSNPGQPRWYHQSVELAIAHARANGVLVVAAMGNNGVDTTSQPVWPADFARYYDNVLAVGASTNADTKANFSNHGVALGLWAPGWFTLSTMPNGGYGNSSGTSMASPVAAGGAALVKASGMASTPQEIRQRLASTAASTSAGPRLDAAAAVGASTTPVTGSALDVVMTGADTLEPDTEGTVSWTVSTGDPADIAGLEVSIAGRTPGGVVGAVEALPVTLTPAGGEPMLRFSDEAGVIGVVPVSTPAQLVGGVSFSATMTLPGADYALVVRAVDSAGQPASDGYVAFASLPVPFSAPSPGDPGGGGSTGGGSSSGGDVAPPPTGGSTTGGSTTGGSTTGGSTSGGSTTGGSGGSTTGGSTTGGSTSGGSDGSTSGGVVIVRPPSDSTSGGTTDGGSTPPAPSNPTPPSSGDGSPSPTDPPPTGGDQPPVPTSPPSDDVGGTEPEQPGSPQQPSGPQAPVETAPPSTTPPPTPVESGDYALSSMSPRSSTIDGGVIAVLSGRFPTDVNVWVWFGEGWSTVVPAFVVSDTELLAVVPSVTEPGIRDVRVRFTTDESHDLRLADAFTYTSRDGGGQVPPPPTGGSTTTGGSATGGSTSGGSTTTGGSSSGSTTGGSTSTGGSSSGDSFPGPGGTDGSSGTDGGSPVPDAPSDPTPPPSGGSTGGGPGDSGGSTGGGAPVQTERAVRGQVGDHLLREVRDGDALFRVASMVWPINDCGAICSAGRLG